MNFAVYELDDDERKTRYRYLGAQKITRQQLQKGGDVAPIVEQLRGCLCVRFERLYANNQYNSFQLHFSTTFPDSPDSIVSKPCWKSVKWKR